VKAAEFAKAIGSFAAIAAILTRAAIAWQLLAALVLPHNLHFRHVPTSTPVTRRLTGIPFEGL
jgi:hypothetical protein